MLCMGFLRCIEGMNVFTGRYKLEGAALVPQPVTCTGASVITIITTSYNHVYFGDKLKRLKPDR